MIAPEDHGGGSGFGEAEAGIVAAILALADQRPDAPAIRSKALGLWRTMTRRDLAGAVLHLAGGLGGHVRPGEPACLAAQPSPEALIADLALRRLCARAVLCDPDDAPDGIAAAIGAARLVLTDRSDLPLPGGAPTVVLLRGEPAAGHGGTVLVLDEVRRKLAPARPRAPGPVPQDGDITPEDHRICFAPLLEPGELRAQRRVLARGGVLDFVERPDTVAEDMEALQPTLCDAPAAFWAVMHEEVEAAARAATGFQRRCYRAALAMNGRPSAGGSVSMPARLARGLVLGRLRNRLGIVRLRRATVTDGDVPAPVRDWFRALGVDVRAEHRSEEPDARRGTT